MGDASELAALGQSTLDWRGEDAFRSMQVQNAVVESEKTGAGRGSRPTDSGARDGAGTRYPGPRPSNGGKTLTEKYSASALFLDNTDVRSSNWLEELN